MKLEIRRDPMGHLLLYADGEQVPFQIKTVLDSNAHDECATFTVTFSAIPNEVKLIDYSSR